MPRYTYIVCLGKHVRVFRGVPVGTGSYAYIGMYAGVFVYTDAHIRTDVYACTRLSWCSCICRVMSIYRHV